MSAAFFDIFGFFAFLTIFTVGIKILKSKKGLPNQVGRIVLLIGYGMIVDAYKIKKEVNRNG